MSSTASSSSFFARVEARCKEIDSLLCVGLDPHMKELFPNSSESEIESMSEEERCDVAFTFCKTIIDLTGMFTMTLFCRNSLSMMVERNWRRQSLLNFEQKMMHTMALFRHFHFIVYFHSFFS